MSFELAPLRRRTQKLEPADALYIETFFGRCERREFALQPLGKLRSDEYRTALALRREDVDVVAKHGIGAISFADLCSTYDFEEVQSVMPKLFGKRWRGVAIWLMSQAVRDKKTFHACRQFDDELRELLCERCVILDELEFPMKEGETLRPRIVAELAHVISYVLEDVLQGAAGHEAMFINPMAAFRAVTQWVPIANTDKEKLVVLAS